MYARPPSHAEALGPGSAGPSLALPYANPLAQVRHPHSSRSNPGFRFSGQTIILSFTLGSKSIPYPVKWRFPGGCMSMISMTTLGPQMNSRCCKCSLFGCIRYVDLTFDKHQARLNLCPCAAESETSGARACLWWCSVLCRSC